MEYQLWQAIVSEVRQLDKSRRRTETGYTDGEIVLTWFWAVLHDRSMDWACQRGNWPIHLRRRPLPSSTTMSRRLRAPGVRKLLVQLEERVLRSSGRGLVWLLDGKPLLTSKVSKDRHTSALRGTRGYKLHVLIDAAQQVKIWRISPLGKDEREMGRRLIRAAGVQGYVVADGNYDAHPLYHACDEQGQLQLVAPLRTSRTGCRRRRQSPGRQRSIARQDGLLDQDQAFVKDLLSQRLAIERYFGNLTSWGGGLTHLPPWVRTHQRVERWVQSKLLLHALRRRLRTRTYVA